MKRHTGKRVLSVLTASLMLTAASQTVIPANVFAEFSNENNLISNATFDSGTTDWGTYKESGGACTLTTENGKLALKVSSLGKVNYAVQVFYNIIPLYQNGVYHLHYEISSSVPRTIEGMIQQNGGTYQAYTWKQLDLTESPLVMDYDFTMEKETDIMTKLVFNCGVRKGEENLPEHTIYIDNVSLELIDDSNVQYEAFKPYAPPIVTNQVGYRTDSQKTAVVRKDAGTDEFKVVKADDPSSVVYSGKLSAAVENSSAKETDRIADFSSVKEPGTYVITCGSLDKSYPFTIADDPYQKLMDDSVRMLYLQRCGCAVEDEKFSHPACHNTMATIYGTNEKIDVTGGWHDAGDYGRYVVPAAKTIADLLYAYEVNPDLFGDNIGIPESGNQVPDVLDEARYELEWMLKMQAQNGGVYHKVSCATFPAYQMPEDEVGELIVTPVSTTATADFAASMALAAEFYEEFDKNFADKCLSAAERAWGFLEQNPDFIFKNPADIVTGDYGDRTDKDERYWAAAQLYRATKKDTYRTALEGMTTSTGMDWSTVGDYGNIALLSMDGLDQNSAIYTAAAKKITSQADTMRTIVQNSPYGSPITKYNWGSNMTIANAGIILGLANRITGDSSYLSAAEAVQSYLLGQNPLGTCFVTGYGTVAPEHPHHRPSMVVGEAMKGMLVGGVNSSLEDDAAKAYCKGEPAAKCYIDNAESYSTNEITIYWNSPLTYLLTLTGSGQADQPSVKYDVNGDGAFNVKDIVALQRYLLTIDDDLADWEAGDVNGDGKLTAVDLSLLKQEILNN